MSNFLAIPRLVKCHSYFTNLNDEICILKKRMPWSPIPRLQFQGVCIHQSDFCQGKIIRSRAPGNRHLHRSGYAKKIASTNRDRVRMILLTLYFSKKGASQKNGCKSTLLINKEVSVFRYCKKFTAFAVEKTGVRCQNKHTAWRNLNTDTWHLVFQNAHCKPKTTNKLDLHPSSWIASDYGIKYWT